MSPESHSLGLDHPQAILIEPNTQNRHFTEIEHLPAGVRLLGVLGILDELPNVVPRS
jgi:hypothetical protein